MKKMLPPAKRARAKTENSNLQPKILPGYVRAERVKCGKPNCKCARGELHGLYFYRYTWSDGKRSKQYVKQAEVSEVRAACAAYRDLQSHVRAGRAEYKRTLAQARELFRMLSR